MKKIIYSAAALIMGLAFTACSSDDDNNDSNQPSEKEQAMQAITNQYVEGVVFPIYKSLAAQTSTLFDQLVDAKAKYRAGSLTQGDIDKICNTFIAARSAWESSESFLYGAATDFGIDPHIDTWPLDRTALAKALSSSEIIDDLDDLDDGGIDNARALVGEQQLGFHGIEFIIFRNGKNRTLAALKGVEDDEAFAGRNITGEHELIFAAAVAGDLRDKCFQLEVSWLGDKAPQAHQERVEECEFPTTVGSGDSSYGDNMLNATRAGSTLATWRSVHSRGRMQQHLRRGGRTEDRTGLLGHRPRLYRVALQPALLLRLLRQHQQHTVQPLRPSGNVGQCQQHHGLPAEVQRHDGRQSEEQARCRPRGPQHRQGRHTVRGRLSQQQCQGSYGCHQRPR